MMTTGFSVALGRQGASGMSQTLIFFFLLVVVAPTNSVEFCPPEEKLPGYYALHRALHQPA